MRFFSLVFTLTPAVFAADCSADERAIWANNQKFGDDFTACSKTAWGNKDSTAACVSRMYPNISTTCSGCFGDAAACGLKNCVWQCAKDAGSQNCLSCIATNCRPALMTCTGCSLSGLPLAPKSNTLPNVVSTIRPTTIASTTRATTKPSTSPSTAVSTTKTSTVAPTTKPSGKTSTTIKPSEGPSTTTSSSVESTTEPTTSTAEPTGTTSLQESSTVSSSDIATTHSETVVVTTAAPATWTTLEDVAISEAASAEITTPKSGATRVTLCLIFVIAAIF